ncbi:GntP family permease [Peribacillus aracenensis]|uniref:GntP family permease n=1 Tax=Peribacillus aracenensis TaxID=2976708 RepID=UPI0021A49641|nr:GntP family permease [Peribacillus sp. BBB004]
MDGQAPEGVADQCSNIHNRVHPGFGITLIMILMPFLLMLIGVFGAVFGEDSILDDGIAFIGKPIISLCFLWLFHSLH